MPPPPPPETSFTGLAIRRWLVAIALSFGTLLFGIPPASATRGPSGIYIVFDPYNTSDLSKLNAAAASGTCAGAEPFCTESNGILLSIDWCRYQGYADANAPGSGSRDYSCHYLVAANSAGPGTVQRLNTADVTHQCGGYPTSFSTLTYDECSGSNMLTALSDIVALNAIRYNSNVHPRPPLHLSLGLLAGAATPEIYFRSVKGTSSAALPIEFTNINNPVCGLEPQVWLSAYISDYLAAYKELISFVNTQMNVTYGSPITLVKVTPLNSTTLEYFLPGPISVTSTLNDPGTPDMDDVVLSCAPITGGGAQQWINAYPASGVSLSVIQAMEQSLGTVAGTLLGDLQANSDTQAHLSLATNNGAAYPQINCGIIPGAGTGTGHTCVYQSSAAQQWSTYYLVGHVDDLFTSGTVAYNAAVAANSTWSSLAAADFYVNTTNLQNPNDKLAGSCPNFGGSDNCQTVSVNSLACNLNETSTSSSQEGSFNLGGSANTTTTGVGTNLGVQTVYGLDGSLGGTNYCVASGTSIADVINYAVKNGSAFVELTDDIAFNSTCQSYYQTELLALTSSTVLNCLY